VRRAAKFSLGVAALVVAFAAWPLDGSLARAASNAGWTLGAAFAFLATAGAVRSGAPHERRTWTSLATACGAWFVGQLAWDWYTATGGSAPTPSVADGLWLAFPLIASVGMYRFATAPANVRRVVDLDALALAITVAGLTIAINWHAIHHSTLDVAGRVTTVAYPTAYSIVAALGVSALVAAPEFFRRRGVMLALAGLLCEGVTFALWCPEVLRGTWTQGASLLDPFWTVGLVLVGAGALVRPHEAEVPAPTAATRLRRRTILPALAFLALAIAPFGLAIGDAPLAPRLAVLGTVAAVGVLLLVRSWLAFTAIEALEAERLLALARRNRELENFAYSASHDLKAPLVSIDGFAGMLERSLGERLGEAEAHYLQRIHANANALQDLIADLFAFARGGPDEREASPVDATVIASELVQEWRDRASEKGMRLRIDGPLPVVRAHPVRLKQALTNLVDNALRYGGGDVRLSGRSTTGAAEILVEDGGAGVPAGERERMFDVFARGEAARLSAPEGTGLGLALVKRIVEGSGGSVRYEHAGGARFVLSFPTGAG
jgi:signal transduction histidine kinase